MMNNTLEDFGLSICEVDLALTPDWVQEFVEAERNAAERVLLVTWLPRPLIEKIGLPRAAVCGLLVDGREVIAPEYFREFPPFVEFLHSLCSEMLDPELIEFAARCAEKRIALIDQRTSDVDGAVPNEDILGLYHVDDGTITEYSPNPNYRLVTAQGSFKLTPWLRQCLQSLVNELEADPS